MIEMSAFLTKYEKNANDAREIVKKILFKGTFCLTRRLVECSG